jgi:hypothetical protein
VSTDEVAAIGSIATAAAVIVAVVELWLNRRQAKSAFEGQLVDQYRQIVAGVPVKALLGGELDDDEFDHALPHLFRYIDLCNEQVFLRNEGRIRPKTWDEWEPGLVANFKRPVFRRAWGYVNDEVRENGHDDFSQLRKLLREKGLADHSSKDATGRTTASGGA